MIEKLDKENLVDRRIIYEISGVKFKNEDFDKDFGQNAEESDDDDPSRPFAKKITVAKAFWGGFKPGVVEPMIGSGSSIND